MLDQIQHIRKVFAADGAKYKSNNAYIGAIFKHNTTGEFHYHKVGAGPCHGAFAVSSLPHYVSELKYTHSIEYLLSQVQNLRVNEADAKMFIEWLVQRSPYQEVFVTKDVDDILKYGFVARTDLPNTFIISALIASRLITESYSDEIVARFPVYKKFIEAGASETEAFLFAHAFNFSKRGVKWEMEVSNLSSGHAAIDLGSRGINYAKNFLTANIVKKTRMFKETLGYESGVFGIWGGSEDKNFSTFARSLKPRTKLDAKNYNIFEKKPTKGYLINNIDDLRDIVEQMKERLYA